MCFSVDVITIDRFNQQLTIYRKFIIENYMLWSKSYSSSYNLLKKYKKCGQNGSVSIYEILCGAI